MNFNRFKPFLPLILFIIVVSASGYLIWRDTKIQSRVATEPVSVSSPNTEVKPDSESQASKTPKTESKNPQTPNLDRPIIISANFNKETRKQVVLDINEIIKTLKDNYNYLQGWLQLGILRKTIGDYDGAIEAWNFAGLIRPNVATPYLNLADLYAFYIKDDKKAEESFARAVKAEPKNGYTYFQTARFYDDVLNNKEKAKSILQQGISYGADSTGDLKLFLDSLQ